MRISKERWDRIKNRARGGAKSAARGAKGSAIAVVAGAAAEIAHAQGTQRVKFLADHWYAGPAVLALGGHFLKRKHHDAGVALLGAAGYAAALAYQANKQSQPSTGQAQGWGDDAGQLVTPDAFRALPDASGPADAFYGNGLNDGVDMDAGMVVEAGYDGGADEAYALTG
jgi:hypothetical protein